MTRQRPKTKIRNFNEYLLRRYSIDSKIVESANVYHIEFKDGLPSTIEFANLTMHLDRVVWTFVAISPARALDCYQCLESYDHNGNTIGRFLE